MKPKMVLKICVDLAMTLALLLLMAYELIGRAAHEWIGIAMFALLVLHHILNRKWSRSVPHGRYTPLRALQTGLVLAVLLCMVGSMVSGVVLSRAALSFLRIRGGQSWARILHLLCAYWGFTLMSLHLGFHWASMMGIAKRRFGAPAGWRAWILRAMAAAIAAYGVYAFAHRKIGSYMFLKSAFVFFNFEEPLIRFFLDYIAVMGLFVCIGHYLAALLKRRSRKGRVQ